VLFVRAVLFLRAVLLTLREVFVDFAALDVSVYLFAMVFACASVLSYCFDLSRRSRLLSCSCSCCLFA
jgi:hypothetical protein